MFQLLRPRKADIEAGFTRVELMIVVAVIGVVSGMAFESFYYVLPTMRADSGMQFLEAHLRQARETAIDLRQNVTVTFQGTGEAVTCTSGLLSGYPACPNAANGQSELSDYILDPNQMTYRVIATVPDTPENFGNSTAVSLNCGATPLPCTITIQSDGTVLDHTGAYINGTVFMGTPGSTSTAGGIMTARAVTIMGTTGRIKGYRYSGNGWFYK